MNDYNTETYYKSGTYWKGKENVDVSYKLRLASYFLRKHPTLIFNECKCADIGCGQGSFLFALAEYLDNLNIKYELYGYDLSSYALDIAEKLNINPHIKFYLGSSNNIKKNIDLIFVMDVVEHVENPFQFFRDLANKTNYVILHLPLEQSLSHMIMKKPSASYKLFQHIHFYSWETAKLLIDHSPFKIIDYQFTGASTTSVKITKNAKKIQNLFRYLAYKINPSIASMIGGGPVMLLLEHAEKH